MDVEEHTAGMRMEPVQAGGKTDLKEGTEMSGMGQMNQGPKLPEIRVLVCIVSNHLITDFQVIEAITPNQFVQIGR